MGRKQLKVPSVWRPIKDFYKWNNVCGRISEQFSNRSAVRVATAGLRKQGRLGLVATRHAIGPELSCAIGWCDRACPEGTQIGNAVCFITRIHDALADSGLPNDKAIDLFETACYSYLKAPSRGPGSAIAAAKRKLSK